MGRGHFRAGFAVADITPDPAAGAVELSGYVAREQPATGVRDHLQASVLALGVEGEPPRLVVGLDLCILDGPMAAAIAAACPLPQERLTLVCSHTHAAPATYPLIGCGRPDPAYGQELALRVGDAARRALAEMAPCRLGWGRRALADPCWGNRRRRDGPRDPRVHLLKLERADSSRAPVCALWSLACHPVVLGSENRLVSADWVGEVRRRLPWPSLFVQGCCGDQNPLRRGPQPEAMAPWEGVAAALADLWQGTPTAAAGPWGWAAASLPLPRLPGDRTAPLPTEPPAVARAMAEWAARIARPGEAVPASPAAVQVAAVGNGRLAFWPGEPFVALQLELPPDVLAVGHSGPSVGYVPDQQAYAAPGYEVGQAHRYYGFPSALAPEAGERLVARTQALLASAL